MTPFQPPTTEPPSTKHCLLSFPDPHVILVLINRPEKLNSLSIEANHELDRVFKWFDGEPTCYVAILSGVGRAFCAGADLHEWMSNNRKGVRLELPANGFGGISLRLGKKPIIAAVNGPAFGGGCEVVVNCDMVIASELATFSLPEVKRGVVALAGALPRLIKTAGRQRAMEMALTGRAVSAREFKEWGLCNRVVNEGMGVVDVAREYARNIAGNSPDAVTITRKGLELGWEALGVADASQTFLESWGCRIYDSPNIQEGLNAFSEKREPRWQESKL